MQLVIRAFLFLAVTLFLLPEPGFASIIFRAGEKAKYVPPGEEEMSGNAAELYQIGQQAENNGDKKRAIRAYKAWLNVTRKTRWLRQLFSVLLNYRNRPANSRQPRIHISSWSKDMRVARILMRRSKGNFVLVRFF